VGCALWVDRILLARQRQGWQPAPLVPDLLWAADACPDCLRVLLALRQRGLRVELDVSGAGTDAFCQRAAGGRTPRVAICDGDGVLLVSGRETRRLSLDELAAEASTW
jgi:hypothetical protein